MKKILKEYEKMKFDIYSDPVDIDNHRQNYETIKKYFNKEISFEKLYSLIDGCPPNCCYWCNEVCDDCDVEGDCEECWKRALKQK